MKHTAVVVVGADAWAETLRICLALAVGYDVIMVLASWVLYDFVVAA